jgi:transglutaminase-like putative cysteine protease
VNDNLKKSPDSSERLKKWLVPEALPAPVSRLGNWRTWVNLAVLFLALEVAVYSIEQAQWIVPQPAFTLVLFLSMLCAWLMVIGRLHGAIIHVVAPVIGVLVTAWQTIGLLPGTASLNHLLNVIQSWWQGAGTLLPDEQKVVFAAFLTLLTWLTGYLSTWFVLRKHNAWVGVFLGVVVIIVNLSNLPGRFYFFFPAFFIASVFLIIQTRIAGQYARSGRGAGYTGKSLLYLFTSLICIIVLAASLAWITPQARASSLQNLISTKLIWKQDIRASKINIFNAVPAKQAINTSGTLKDLPFEGGWNQGNNVHFTVKADRPAYWPMNIYDIYTPEGWINSPTSDQLLDAKAIWPDTNVVNFNDLLKYQVTTEINVDVLLVAGDFVSSSSPVLIHQNADNDVMEVTTPRVLAPGESYSMETVLTNPTADQLAGAGENYPQSVTDNYLQLPPDYSEDVKSLSENITAGAPTPYAKVMAVIKYLSAFPYEPIIDAPPPGADGVTYFLFTQKGGFCLYFASAMAVMLRSVDIPTRLVVGYLPGDPGEERGTYLVRDWHYHAWPQVYFPGYGWVNFEATPSGGGGSGSQVSVQTPLVSSPAISELPQWNAWNYPPPPSGGHASAPPPSAAPADTHLRFGALPFAHALGHVLVIVILIAVIIGGITGLLLIIRRVFNRRLWHVDRESLAYTTYTKLCRIAAMAKIYPRPQQTPLEFAAELKAALPEDADAIDKIVQAYLENRFGKREGKLELYQEAQVLKARHLVYDKLLRLMGKRTWGLKVFSPGG